MQGIYVDRRRPKSKKEIKDAIAVNPERVQIEATSIFGNEYDGLVSDAPAGRYDFVGPDPYTSRKFYGSIVRTADGRISVR